MPAGSNRKIVILLLVMTLLTGDGKQLPALIAGAALFSVIGTASVMAIQRFSRLKDDAALGIVLSVYFGLGIALMGMATRMDAGNAAGLSSFIYGKTASMLFSDALLIAITAFVAAVASLLFFKEFALVCFDADYGTTQGWPVGRLDFFMMALVVEIAFNELRRSSQYLAGMALRFARAKRYRNDKTAAQADTLEAVRSLFDKRMRGV